MPRKKGRGKRKNRYRVRRTPYRKREIEAGGRDFLLDVALFLINSSFRARDKLFLNGTSVFCEVWFSFKKPLTDLQ